MLAVQLSGLAQLSVQAFCFGIRREDRRKRRTAVLSLLPMYL